MLRHFVLCYRVLERRDNVKESAKSAKGEKQKGRERESGKAQRQHNRWSQRQQLSKRCAQKALVAFSASLPISLSLFLSLLGLTVMGFAEKCQRNTETTYTYVHYVYASLSLLLMPTPSSPPPSFQFCRFLLSHDAAFCIFIFNCISNWTTVRAPFKDK